MGIGYKALTILFDIGKRSNQKVNTIMLGVLSSNTNAYNLYKKMGFVDYSKVLVKKI